MKEAGFGGVFVNIGDYPADAWEEVVRPRAQGLGMFCGPWARTADSFGRFDYSVLDRLVFCADDWGSPLLVNSEKELDGSGREYTQEIADTVGGREAAVSMLPTPFHSVDWTPLADIPILMQIFPPDQGQVYDPVACADMWHQWGVKCAFATYATYGGMTPEVYSLKAPYSLYTADDCGNNFQPWSPTSTGFQGCVQAPVPPDGGDMETIGSQHGITGFANWLRSQADAPQRGPGYDPEDVDTWPWPDKIERTLNILRQDHDLTTTVFDVAAQKEEER
jgi:hypothetical protein